MLTPYFIAFFIGVLLTLLFVGVFHHLKMGSYQKLFSKMLETTEKEILEKKHRSDLQIQKELFEHQSQIQQRLNKTNKKVEEEKFNLKLKEDKLINRTKLIEKKQLELKEKSQILDRQNKKLLQEKEFVLDEKNSLITSLEKVSKLSQREAEEKLFDKLKLETRKSWAVWNNRFLKDKKESASKDATKIISLAIQRQASAITSQYSITSIALPREDLKSKIIGREGRNIHHFENTLGVNLLVDETPKSVVISSLDPFRKAVAVEVLKNLIADGRVHPTKIDEEHQKAKIYIEKKTYQKAEDYALRLGINNLHPKILSLMAKLDLMDSLGQNILDHSYQVALLLGVMAQELGLDLMLARRIGFLHDMGKALASEVEGTHALIGKKFALRHGESEQVANGIGCHHNEISPITIEGSLCGSADAISASRPGARTESLKHHIKRVKKLEEIALSFEEVEKAYALQSGKEIRIITLPDKVDDASLSLLAQNISQKIEKDLKYLGQIKISVMRQHQVIDFAS